MLMMFVIQLLVFAMSSSVCSINNLPHELMVKILSQSDQPMLHGILCTQKKIEAERTIHFTGHALPGHIILGKIIESTIHQKSFIEIRNAFFLCLPLLRTCKDFYNNSELKNDIKNTVIENLTHIIPQGIALFLIPKSLQNPIVRAYYMKKNLNNQIRPQDLLVQVCFQEKAIECLQTSLFPPTINQIIYEPMRDTILAYTALEYILYRQSSHKYYYKYHHSLRQQQDYFFKVFNYVCLLPEIDLELPAAQSEKNIAGYIYDLLKTQQSPDELASKEALKKIESTRHLPVKEPLKEDSLLIKKVVQVYLNPPTAIKEALLKKKLLIEHKEIRQFSKHCALQLYGLSILCTICLGILYQCFYNHI